ncbi:pirin family protein [Hydrogenibacillus schlegelii]|uniref:Pirin N-terminal domain-containing protein n=1 Tax=Hydrogenibacillus schlegelii TaxID=1484 RepID=A0A132MGS9_HYDSH|nr:pirin family protein [Hydrogenibacillus schlegelii]KWW97003.1 hypothetical protein TR75_10970 [Hydrogenibacillus schlegelii]OAR05207.1 hypothetical protein SA87_05415 [Hydrogenibacillus schlegelii]
MAKVLPLSPTTDGEGAQVRRLMPTRTLFFLDPFLLLDHFAVSPPAGFPPHPHRGFEIITYMLEGAFRHADDAGHEGVIFAGGAQRITAGSGIWHSEMPGTDGVNEGLQLWINLPRSEKGIPPGYQDVPPEAFPVHAQGGVTVKTIVGSGSPIEILRPMRYEDVTLASDGRYRMEIPNGDQGLVYPLAGRLRVQLRGGAEDGRVLEVPAGSALVVLAGEAAELDIEPAPEGAEEKASATGPDASAAGPSASTAPARGTNGAARLVAVFGTPIGERPVFRGSFVD